MMHAPASSAEAAVLAFLVSTEIGVLVSAANFFITGIIR